jgi:hypothetical protein
MGEDVVWAVMGGVTSDGNRGRLSRYTFRIGVGRPRFERETLCRNCEQAVWTFRREGFNVIENIGRKRRRRTGAGRTGGRGRELEVMVWCGVGGGGVFGDDYLLFMNYSI